MRYVGDIAEDATIRWSFNTIDSTGAPITLAGTPSLAVYKDADTTQSTAGLTLSVDHDGVTGLHLVTIDTSADAFYATASDYAVVLAAGTVDSVSVVGRTVGMFSIRNRDIATASALATAQTGINTAVTQTTAGSIRAGLGMAAADLDDQLDALATAVGNIAAANPGTGDGDTAVNHNTGGADELAYKTSGGTGIDNAKVLAYVKSEYDANPLAATLRAATVTDSDGRWVATLMLNSGIAYTIRFEKPGVYGPDFDEVTP